ncbi:MAG: glycerate kinase [Halobacteriales archaeon]
MIRDADALVDTPVKATAIACIEAGIQAAHPRNVVQQAIRVEGDRLVVAETEYDLAGIERVVVLGGGKAAGTAAAALESVLGERLESGAVVCPDPVDTGRVAVQVGDHPVPSDRSVAGTRELLALAEDADASTLVLTVITGGGSALMAAPAPGVALEDLQTVTDGLLESGASIHEINAVRKHLSAIKGGGLARTAAPAQVVSLLFSDVVGDELDVIASGPTAPDASTFADAIGVLDRYAIEIPAAVRDRLDRGDRGEIDETAGPDDPIFDRVSNHVIANGFTALSAARETALDHGYEPCLLSSRIRGEAREAARSMAAIGEEVVASGHPIEPPAVLLAGGECTVTVSGEGSGGPNQEFALAAALEFEGTDLALATVDTDGRDGATDAAGALIDGGTVENPEAARDALAANNAYPYLDDREALLATGPTGTNVNDIRALVIEESA